MTPRPRGALWSLRALDDEIATIRTSLARFDVERKTLDERITAAARAARPAPAPARRHPAQAPRDRARDRRRRDRGTEVPEPAARGEEERGVPGAASRDCRRQGAAIRPRDPRAAAHGGRGCGSSATRPQLDLGLRTARSRRREGARARGSTTKRRRIARGSRASETSRRARVAELEPLVRSRYERIHASSIDGRAVVPGFSRTRAVGASAGSRRKIYRGRGAGTACWCAKAAAAAARVAAGHHLIPRRAFPSV